MKYLLLLFFLPALAVSGQSNHKSHQSTSSSPAKSKQNNTKTMSDYSPNIENAHPNAKRLMNEEFFWSTIEETAPFGNDDGADTYAGFAEWRRTNKTANPKQFLNEQIDYWGYPKFDFNETNLEKLNPYINKSIFGTRMLSGIDAAIIAIAFGQLYLEGTIDKDFKELAKTAIRRELIPELLNRWGDEIKNLRETQLHKMLVVLDKVD